MERFNFNGLLCMGLICNGLLNRHSIECGSFVRGSTARCSTARGSSARGSSVRGSSERDPSVRSTNARSSSVRAPLDFTISHKGLYKTRFHFHYKGLLFNGPQPNGPDLEVLHSWGFNSIESPTKWSSCIKTSLAERSCAQSAFTQ